MQVRVTNLDTRETTADVPVQVNGTERGRLVATLAAGETANAHADVEALDRGSYELQIQGARKLVDVRSPAEPSVNITLWPQQPHPGENVTVGARIANAGEAPYRETVTIEVDGHPILEEDVVVASDEIRTVTRTLAPLAEGSHMVEVFDERGEALASRSFEAREPEAAQTPAAGALLALTLIALVARLWPARGPR